MRSYLDYVKTVYRDQVYLFYIHWELECLYARFIAFNEYLAIPPYITFPKQTVTYLH